MNSLKREKGVIWEEAPIEHPLSTHSASIGTRWSQAGYLHALRMCAVMLVMLFTLGVGEMWGAKTYTYNMTYAGGSASAGSNVSYWYSNSGCTTNCKIESGSNNRFTSAITIYYEDATLSSTAFTVTPAGTSAYATFKLNSTACYFFLGKQNATLTLPTYSGEKITNVTITRGAGGSNSATVNIFSGTNAASTEQTFASAGTAYSFDITSTYQRDALTIKLTGEYNTSFNQIVITTESANCTVTYDGNGKTSGTVPTDASSPYAPGSNVTVKTKGDLARTGCTFAGWNTKADGSGDNYAENGTISSIANNITLYAKWTATVTWIINGSTERTDANLVIPASGKSVTPPTAPSPASYCGDKFMGWTTTNIGSTGLDKDTQSSEISALNLFTGAKTVTGDVTFYAVFANYAE